MLKEKLDLNSITTVLDLGCGSFVSHPMHFPENDLLYSVFNSKDIKGIDIFEADVLWRRKNGPPGDYICMNILDYDIKDDFDVIICHHTLEHITQEEHDIIFNRIENMNYKYAILGGPVGKSNNDLCITKTNNKYQKHLINLDPSLYEKHGYDIYIFSELNCDDAFLAIKEKIKLK